MAIASSSPTLLVDLAGDVPAMLGMPEPDGAGLFDWLRSDAPATRLAALEVAALATCHRAPARARCASRPIRARWVELADWLRSDSRHVIVDAGSTPAPPAELVRAADHALLVTRPCYLALRAAIRHPARPTGIVLVDEPGRALGTRDIETSLGAPVVANVLLDPAMARAVDAGLLAARLPAGFRQRRCRLAA